MHGELPRRPDPMPVTWDFAKAPIPKADVERLESEWGVKFPDDYVACVLENNAGTPGPDAVPVPGRGDAQFNRLLNVNEPENPRHSSMRRAVRGIGKWLPK